MALHGLQRLKQQFPTLEVAMVTYTFGSWSNRLVEPDFEAERIAEHMLTNLRITVPVGIWKGKKVVNEDGGYTPADAGPTMKNYPHLGTPTLWVFDGKGIVRRVVVGYSRDQEAQLARTVQFLEREATSTVGLATP